MLADTKKINNPTHIRSRTDMKIIASFPFSGGDEFCAANKDQILDLRGQLGLVQLQNAIASGKPVMVHSSVNALNMLEDLGLSYYLVYPSAECKDEWVARIPKDKHSHSHMISTLWESLLEDLYRRRRACPLILGGGMSISDVLYLQDDLVKLKD